MRWMHRVGLYPTATLEMAAENAVVALEQAITGEHPLTLWGAA